MSFLLAGAAVVSAGVGIAKAIGSNKKQKAAERKEARARAEMDKQKAAFAGLDTSNPFLNMENTMEDLTINQQEAQIIMGQLKGAAGGSGIAALAQQMAQSGQLASQESAGLIGAQESANQKLERAEASRLQGKEREGEVQSRDWERDKVSTLLGMAQGETAGFADQAAGYEAAKWEGIGQVAGAVTSGLTGGM